MGGMGGGFDGGSGGGTPIIVMSFAADVMPVLKAKCAGCHNGVYDNAATTLTRLRATTGAAGACANIPRMIINNGADSLIVKKLLGTAGCGAVMPLIKNSPTEIVPCSGTQCVAATDIDKVKVWIDQGALDN